jgi:hypothetical protein
VIDRSFLDPYLPEIAVGGELVDESAVDQGAVLLKETRRALKLGEDASADVRVGVTVLVEPLLNLCGDFDSIPSRGTPIGAMPLYSTCAMLEQPPLWGVPSAASRPISSAMTTRRAQLYPAGVRGGSPSGPGHDASGLVAGGPCSNCPSVRIAPSGDFSPP